MSKLLIDENPLVVLPSLAEAIGLSDAIFLQQLHYWLERSGHERDGRRWIYNTYADWARQFPWWNPGSIRRIIGRLRKRGIVLVTDVYNRSPIDKTLWYTLDYEALDNLTTATSELNEADSKGAEQPEELGDQVAEIPAEIPTVENDSPCVPKVQSICTQGTDDVYRGYSPSVPKARSNNQRITTENTSETTTERREKTVDDGSSAGADSADSASHLPLDDFRSALCAVLKKDYALLPQRKQEEIEDVIVLFRQRGITAEQVHAFPAFWEEVQPLGPAICATTPHLKQVQEFMMACVAWQAEQRRRAEEAAIAFQEARHRRQAFGRSVPDLSHYPTADIPEQVQGWWDQLLSEMRLSLQPAVFERWLEQARLIEANADVSDHSSPR